MSKEKRIEDMREKIRTEISKAVEGGLVTWTEFADWLTEALYNEGYRKQSEGEWITEGDELRNTTCSVCNYWVETPYGKTPYCPNCGAKMKGGAEE